MRIALTGNPNSGKTTMFNALTGRNEKVGNWAGVTVERKESPIRPQWYDGERELIAVDLPGAYSMSPFTSEERVTYDYVRDQSPDVIVNIVDATNLSRSLFFTTQLLELGIPMVVALNKTDMTRKKQTRIDTAALSMRLGCPVIETTSTTNQGLKELIHAALSRAGHPQRPPQNLPAQSVTDLQSSRRAARERFRFVNELVSQVEKRTVRTADRNRQDQIDTLLTHPVFGLGIFAVVMFLVFQLSQAWIGPWIAEGVELPNGTVLPGLVTLIDSFKDQISGLLEGGNAFLVALLTEGIIGGFSAVVGFLPLVMVMYFLIALLEDCGYMARATVVLDPIFKKVGLSGRSVIPFVIGTGCAIPGIMAARTIHDPRERCATAMLAPFMPCGAKLPMIALFSGAFFDKASWVGTLMYFVGIAVILLGALLVNTITGVRGRKSYFIIELPEYKLPSVKRAALSMVSRGWSYVVKAGTVILLCNAAVYIMQSFDWRLQLVAEDAAHTSILASVASPIAVVLIPIVGIKAWELAAATVTGFIAKENVVGTLAVCYGISNLIDTEALEMAEGAGAEVAAVFGITKAAALAYLMLNLFSPPCFAAIGAMNAELDNKKWLFGGIALQLGVGYCLGYLVYTVGTLLSGETLHIPSAICGGIAVAVMVATVAWLCVDPTKKLKAGYAVSGKK